MIQCQNTIRQNKPLMSEELELWILLSYQITHLRVFKCVLQLLVNFTNKKEKSTN